jgi:glycosyltransferase involved in cell wall biosynthesis
MLLVSSDTFPPRRVDVSVLFGEELAARGHVIDSVMQSEAGCRKAYVTRWAGGRAWVGATDLGTSLLSRLHKHVRGIGHDLLLLRLVRRGHYDVILAKDKFIAGLIALIAARRARVPFVFWLSFPFPEESLLRARDGTARYPLLYRIRGLAFSLLLYRLILPKADHILVQSEQMRRDVAAHAVALQKMTAVPMGIDPEQFRPQAQPDGRSLLPADRRCILYLGTLSKVRRLDFLVRVLAIVRAEVPGALLYLVGAGDDPSDEQVLIEEARRLKVSDGVVLVGQRPRLEALRFVLEADVCVSPFFPNPILNSTSPTKLVEYMALGKAVVANDHPEQRLVIEQSGGGCCVPWDETAFAAAIVKLLRDPETAAHMGARGRAYVLEHRSYRNIADLVENILQGLVRPAQHAR